MFFLWRLLIVNVINASLTLVDPYEEASDGDRVFNEFENFLNTAEDSSSFGPLKRINWTKHIYTDI